jgi:hypothetical protein
MSVLYCFEIGNDKDVRLLKTNNKLAIVIREISSEQSLFPNKVTIDTQQWFQLRRYVENTSKGLVNVVNGKGDVDFIHLLKGALFIQVHSPYKCVTIRDFISVSQYDQYTPNPERLTYNGHKLKAQRHGIALRELEWLCLKEHTKTVDEIINLQSFNFIFKFGDITKLESVECIVQQCNCLTVRNHELSKTISKKYPWADLYKQRRAVQRRNLAIPEDRGVPGTVEIMKSPQNNVPDVLCLLAQ